jgi:hypothetical protein
MSECEKCGRDNGHYLGCANAPGAAPSAPAEAAADLCAKDGCSNPRAASKGPRPAKYCEDHKTGSKK